MYISFKQETLNKTLKDGQRKRKLKYYKDPYICKQN